MKPLRLLFLLLVLSTVARAQTPAPKAAARAAVKPAPKLKPVSADAHLARARRLKAGGRLSEARREIYKIWEVADEDEEFRVDPRASYMLGWIDIASHRRASAISEFRSALASGLRGRDAVEARAALRRMGVSESFPRLRRRPRSVASMMRTQALMADFFKPTPLEWARQTAIISVVVALMWAFIMGAQVLAAREKWNKREWLSILGWVAALVALRALGQFAVSFRHILPLAIAYFVLAGGQFLAALFYGTRRLTTKKVMDKGGIRIWGAFYTLLFLGFVGGSTGLGAYFWGLEGAFILGWLAFNVGLVACLRAGKLKNKGDIAGAIALLERVRGWRRLNDRSRFAVVNDLASLYAGSNQPQLALERGQEALRFVHAWKSAQVMVHANLAESLLAMGQRDAAIDQLSQVWHLTETADCLNGPAMWQGATHGILAEINFWRGWMDEANRQANLCLAAFPPEQRATPTAQNLVAMSRAIKGAGALSSGDLDAAQKYLELAPKTNPKRTSLAFVHLIASTVCVAANDGEGAGREARAALAASPSYFPAQVQLARVLDASGRPEEARQLLLEALPHHKNNHLAPQARALLRELGVAVTEPRPMPEKALAIEAPEPLLLGEAGASSPSPITI